MDPCLLAILWKNGWTDFHEIFCQAWHKTLSRLSRLFLGAVQLLGRIGFWHFYELHICVPQRNKCMDDLRQIALSYTGLAITIARDFIKAVDNSCGGPHNNGAQRCPLRRLQMPKYLTLLDHRWPQCWLHAKFWWSIGICLSDQTASFKMTDIITWTVTIFWD